MSNAEQSSTYGFATRAIHAGQDPDAVTGAVMPPISLSTTFIQKSPGVEGDFVYSRTANPTRNAFETCLAACEGAKHGIAFGSGLAATSAIIHLLKAGDTVVSIDDIYGGTNRYFRRIAANFGLKFEFVDFTKEDELEAHLAPEEAKLVWLETPTNPTLKITDIERIATLAKKHNCLLAVDNTFMTPACQNPLSLGADIVLHSATKYINGHSDVVMGVLAVNSDELNERIRFIQNGMGAVPGILECYLATRSLKTLDVRMQRHEENAFAVAKFLEAHPKVDRVLYPGLPSHPNHEIAKKQNRGFGGMITFFLKGGMEQSRVFLESVKLFLLAESLGGVESLIEHPALMTHASVPEEQRKVLGIDDTLVRVSVGIEAVDDLIADLKSALDKVPAA